MVKSDGNTLNVYPLRDENGVYYVLRNGNAIYTSQLQRGDQLGYYAQIGQSSAPHLHLTRKLYNPQAGNYTRNYADPILVLP